MNKKGFSFLLGKGFNERQWKETDGVHKIIGKFFTHITTDAALQVHCSILV
jgi:hypothetical protein